MDLTILEDGQSQGRVNALARRVGEVPASLSTEYEAWPANVGITHNIVQATVESGNGEMSTFFSSEQLT